MQNKNVKLVIVSGLMTALTAVGAFIKIPFYPVPFTLQTFMTALAGLLLPPRWAALSQITYLVTGLAGIPVFANGGGLGYVLQPTFGYLLFLPIAAFTISFFNRRFKPQRLILQTALVWLGMFLTLLGGATWLYINLVFIVEKKVGFWQVFYSGLFIFILPTTIEAFVASLLSRIVRRRAPNLARLTE